MPLRPTALAFVILSCLAVPRPAGAGDWDLSLLGGLAFPTWERRFLVGAPVVPPVPVVLQPSGDLVIDASGGAVLGVALAREFAGVVALEARFDSTAIDLRASGLSYDLTYTAPPLPPLTGRVSLASGTLDTDRLSLLSLNLRLRTPGPVSFVASGGVSYLPDFKVTGRVPLEASVGGLPAFDANAALTVRVSPAASGHRFGMNGGAGLRVQVAPRVSLFGEGRLFYFSEYELTLAVDNPELSPYLSEIEAPRFRPVIVNVVGGLVFSF